MRPIILGSRMAERQSEKSFVCLGLGCRNLWFPLPLLVVNLNPLSVCFGSGSTSRQPRVETLPFPLSVAPRIGFRV